MLAPDQAVEMPSVAPAVVGRPYTHAYMLASRVAGPHRCWGAPQVCALWGLVCLTLRMPARGTGRACCECFLLCAHDSTRRSNKGASERLKPWFLRRTCLGACMAPNHLSLWRDGSL